MFSFTGDTIKPHRKNAIQTESTGMHQWTGRYVYEQPTQRAATECPVEEWLAFLGHRWNAAILWHLSASPRRFGELKVCLPGITPKVLTERLEGLERWGLVERSARSFPAPRLHRRNCSSGAIAPIHAARLEGQVLESRGQGR